MTLNPSPRPHLSMAEQAELEFELRYRGNMIVDQQRKIQQLEEELKRTRDQVDMMNNQISSFEQERMKEKKKPQSRYWTPDEHQRFLEALTKYGHKDVKAISMHVSTRNATQVRTHAQKYFLRLERERRKKGEDDGTGKDKDHDMYSSGDDMYNSDQSLSPIEDMSPPTSGVSSPCSSAPGQQSILAQSVLSGQPPRRRRSTSLIAPTMSKYAVQHQSAVLAELPTWSVEDYENFCKGLLLVADKQQEDVIQICRSIRDSCLNHLSVEDVETCYRVLHKILKSKPIALTSTPVGSPKRRRTSKPELPVGMMSLNDGPLPNILNSSNNNTNNNNNNFAPFMGGMSNVPGSPLPPPPQYMNTNSINNSPSNGSSVTLLPFQPNLMNMGGIRPMSLDYNNMPSMASLQIGNSGMSNNNNSNNMGMFDLPPSNMNSNNPHSSWNSFALSFDLHQNSHALSLPHQGAPLVSSLN